MIDAIKLPEWLSSEINNYVTQGIAPASFCRSLMANDLMMTYAYADEWLRANMFDVLQYVHQTTPKQSRGSYRKVDIWINKLKKDEHGEAN